MMAFFLSVSASFSTTFCFWMEMSSLVFSPSLSGRNSEYQLCMTKHVTVSHKNVTTNTGESVAPSESTCSWKPKLRTIQHGRYMDGWLLCIRFYAHPDISQESNSAQTLKKPVWWDYKLSSLVRICTQKRSQNYSACTKMSESSVLKLDTIWKISQTKCLTIQAKLNFLVPFRENQ